MPSNWKYRVYKTPREQRRIGRRKWSVALPSGCILGRFNTWLGAIGFVTEDLSNRDMHGSTIDTHRAVQTWRANTP